MPDIQHSALTSVHRFAHVASSDPGAVGAYHGWIDTSTAAPFAFKIRNAANTAWETVGILGADGADGADGVGVPVGGTTGQVLAKINGTDFNTEWVDPTTGGASTLASLTDVDLTGLSDGDILVWDAGTSSWVAAAPGSGGASDLNSLTDVIISTPTTGQVLKYNGTNWVNDTDNTNPVSTIVADNFNDNSIDGAIWTGAGTGVSETGGMMEITHTAGSSIKTANAYNLWDRAVSIKLDTPVTGSSSKASQFAMSSDAFATAKYPLMDNYLGNLRCQQGGTGGAGTVHTETFNASVHKYFRFKIQGNGFSYQYSTDGITYYTLVTIPAWTELNAMVVYLQQFNTSGTSQTTKFDDFLISNIG